MCYHQRIQKKVKKKKREWKWNHFKFFGTSEIFLDFGYMYFPVRLRALRSNCSNGPAHISDVLSQFVVFFMHYFLVNQRIDRKGTFLSLVKKSLCCSSNKRWRAPALYVNFSVRYRKMQQFERFAIVIFSIGLASPRTGVNLSQSDSPWQFLYRTPEIHIVNILMLG